MLAPHVGIEPWGLVLPFPSPLFWIGPCVACMPGSGSINPAQPCIPGLGSKHQVPSLPGLMCSDPPYGAQQVQSDTQGLGLLTGPEIWQQNVMAYTTNFWDSWGALRAR